jgi:AcrR family transcriptional regulator
MARSALEKARETPTSTKARILSAAQEVFAARGFEGASTREIASAAGVNISSLHYHWQSKETLYFAVFQNIYDQILELVRGSLPNPPVEGPVSRTVVDQSMGRLFDFFADHPSIPKLLVRNLLEGGDSTVAIERDILLPAWRHFATWTQELSKHKSKDFDLQIFMLTVHSVLLLFLLDSRQYTSLLGGSARSPEIRERLRSYIIGLVHKLVSAR